MSDLVSGLLAKLDSLERLAQAATAGPWRYNPGKEWHEPTALAFPPGWRPRGEEFVGAGPLESTVGVAATGPADHPQSMADAAFIAANGPDAVLRLCRAHRDIIEMYQQAKARPVQRDRGKLRGLDHASAMGRLTTLGLVLQSLAEGYGLQERGTQ
jgi:hypothetical protein